MHHLPLPAVRTSIAKAPTVAGIYVVVYKTRNVRTGSIGNTSDGVDLKNNYNTPMCLVNLV